MTACVAMGPDSRMDRSTAAASNRVDSIHGRMSSDLDPSFRPGVGLMTNVDVLSAYMTAAHEIVAESSRGVDRLAPYISTAPPTELTPDSTCITSEDINTKLPLSHKMFRAPLITSSQEREPAVPAAQECIIEEEAETRIELQQPVPVAKDLVEDSSSLEKPVEESAETGFGASVGTEASEVNQDFIETKEPDEEPAVTENSYSGNPVVLSTTGAAESLTKTEAMDDTAENLAVNPRDGYVENSEGQTTETPALDTKKYSFQFTGLNHVAFCCESLERSLEFYCGLLGLTTNLDRPDLPYRGAWLFLGAEGIHIMEVPNPDPVKGRPAHGGWDRHACLNVTNVDHLKVTLEKAGIEYQLSPVPSIFCRDPDGNGLEFIEV